MPDHPGLTVHTADAPWTTVVGGLPVRVGHGHRVADPWNDIDPEAVLRAVETGDARVALPPGSRLVLELLNPLKLAVHRSTGAQRFPFLDLLKPELATVTLLLPYLDWDAAEDKVGTFGGLAARRASSGASSRRCAGAPVLGSEQDERAGRRRWTRCWPTRSRSRLLEGERRSADGAVARAVKRS